MMNFKSIQKYLNYNGYYRIKTIKSKQKTNQKSEKPNTKDYDNYLDKISGFQCCCKETCNCCCTYSLEGCCRNNTTQTYTTSTDHCICFKGMMEVRFGLGLDASGALISQNQRGYNDISGQIIIGGGGTGGNTINPYGSLHPKNTCEGLTIRSITYIDNPITITPNLQVTFSGNMWGGTSFKCIILTKDKKVIKLYRGQWGWPGINAPPSPENPQTWNTTNPPDGPFTSYYWRIPDNQSLTEGTWCVQISI
jgi:hypothetical protein